MAQSPESMARSMISNLKDKTGRTLDQWLRIVGKQPLKKNGEIVKFLKSEHDMTHGFANLVAKISLRGKEVYQPTSAATDKMLDQQYAGPKAGLKPIYLAVIKMAQVLGEDVVISSKKNYVSFRRHKQFGIIQPSTRTRVDIGLLLKDVPPVGRLELSGSFNAMVTHRVKLTEKKEVNAELKQWLERAYDMS
ncbi:MAG: DUF4287 domain-containing protein [Pirellulaceae bacterium]|nr:DUF4287 domain-containing protein [Pirellulaceae bacterium]